MVVHSDHAFAHTAMWGPDGFEHVVLFVAKVGLGVELVIIPEHLFKSRFQQIGRWRVGDNNWLIEGDEAHYVEDKRHRPKKYLVLLCQGTEEILYIIQYNSYHVLKDQTWCCHSHYDRSNDEVEFITTNPMTEALEHFNDLISY